MRLIWSAKNLGERTVPIFSRPNFWELRYYEQMFLKIIEKQCKNLETERTHIFCDQNVKVLPVEAIAARFHRILIEKDCS